jgi:hypothetical protein
MLKGQILKGQILKGQKWMAKCDKVNCRKDRWKVSCEKAKSGKAKSGKAKSGKAKCDKVNCRNLVRSIAVFLNLFQFTATLLNKKKYLAAPLASFIFLKKRNYNDWPWHKLSPPL